MSMIKSVLFGGMKRAGAPEEVVMTIMRVYAGLALLIFHGWGKLPPSEQWIERTVETMGFPLPYAFAWAAALSESLGGLLVAVGLFTRPAAFFALGTMVVASYWHIMHSPGLEEGFMAAFGAQRGAERAMLFGVIFLAFVVLGSGRFSVDALIRRSTS